MQERIRNCTNPIPDEGGKDCKSLGVDSETRTCNTQPCPGDKYLYVETIYKTDNEFACMLIERYQQSKTIILFS